MAARNFASNRTYNWHLFPVQLDAQITIGASGDPTLVTSTTVPGSSPTASQKESRGIKSITRLAAGTYRIQLDDNFSDLYDFNAFVTSAVTGSDIPVDATTVGLTVGVPYQITAVGTATTAANWVTLGLPAGMTATIGQVFVALTTGTGTQSGAGTVKAFAAQSGGTRAKLLGDPRTMLNAQPFNQGGGGGYITFQTMAGSTASVFTGSALGNHTHDLTLKNAAVSDGATTRVNAGTNLLGANTGSDITVAGAGASGGIANASAGTPAGTIANTSTSVASDPANGCTMYIKMLLSNSSIQ